MLQACAAYTPPPSPAVRGQYGIIAVVPASYVPASNFVAGREQYGEGATFGPGGQGLVNLGYALSTPGSLATYPSPLIPIFVATVVVAGTVTAIDISLHSVPAEKVNEIESAIRESTARLDAQRALAGHLSRLIEKEQSAVLRQAHAAGPATTRAAPLYGELRGKGVDSVLEVGITEILFAGCQYQGWLQSGERFMARHDLVADPCPGGVRDPELYLSLQAKVRMVRVSDDTELLARGFQYRGARRPLAEWMADDARALKQELDRAFLNLAQQTADAAFLVTSVELPMPSSFGHLPELDPSYGACWLAPLAPTAEPVTVGEMSFLPFTRISKRNLCPGSAVHFSKVDSLQPTLRWEAFPRAIDRQKLDPAVLDALGPVTYDLRLWEVKDCVRKALIYERTRLARPEHALETPLAAGQRYFWSVRARFRVDGRPNATPWAFFSPGLSCFLDDIPEGQYHRFITPE